MEEQEILEIEIGDLRHAYEKMQEVLNDLKDVDGLDEESIEVEYYNNKYKCTCTADYYAGDYEEEMTKDRTKFNGFNVNLTPIEREDKHVKNK